MPQRALCQILAFSRSSFLSSTAIEERPTEELMSDQVHSHEHSHGDVSHSHAHVEHDHSHVEHQHEHTHDGTTHSHDHVHAEGVLEEHAHSH
jgi:hypothetical protein